MNKPMWGSYGSSSIPNFFTTMAKSQKQTTVITTLAAIVPQNPQRGSRPGKARNIGNVGTTYQNVYHA